jgi:hypothetical protein
MPRSQSKARRVFAFGEHDNWVDMLGRGLELKRRS